ncbi:MAG: DNA translocase FtsK, partial [bacterium]|nr:DNA translocase FtsK [bacterium]
MLDEGREGFKGMGGALGFLVSFPLLKIFGFWVALLILGAALAAALVLCWKFLDHPESDEDEDRSIAEKVQEHMKRILEPKFDIESVDPEPKQKEQASEKEEKKLAFFPVPVARSRGASSLIPPLSLLDAGRSVPNAGDIKTYAATIKKTLENFDIDIEMAEVNVGPAVTQYAFKPAEGVKLSRITGLANDLALSLAAHPLRIEAPIPGKSLVGIEIPNRVRARVLLRSVMEESKFGQTPFTLPIALGRDVAGTPVVVDLSRMPHMMVAGATGSGKTIALNNIIVSLLYKQTPDNLRLVLVDPKRVEFPVYNDLPHLLTPVILDTQGTINILKWLIKEMERRFHVLSRAKARDIGSYHALYAE